MNIQTVANNLRNTIAGKEKYLAETQIPTEPSSERIVKDLMVRMLTVNIDELKRVLQDVEQCVKQASDDSWITNPDRMGGCYAEDELRNEGWK